MQTQMQTQMLQKNKDWLQHTHLMSNQRKNEINNKLVRVKTNYWMHTLDTIAERIFLL